MARRTAAARMWNETDVIDDDEIDGDGDDKETIMAARNGCSGDDDGDDNETIMATMTMGMNMFNMTNDWRYVQIFWIKFRIFDYQFHNQYQNWGLSIRKPWARPVTD